MFNRDAILELDRYIKTFNNVNSKEELRSMVVEYFGLKQYKKSLFYNNHFAIRFSYTSGNPHSLNNTILSLSTLRTFDNELPIILCVISPTQNILKLINTSFIQGVSHSSQDLSLDNIVGSIQGGDIINKIGDVDNAPENFGVLFEYHLEMGGFEGNIERIVEATNLIESRVPAFIPTIEEEAIIYDSIKRFFILKGSGYLSDIFYFFEQRIEEYKPELLYIAKYVDNINLRGNIMEYIIVNGETTDIGRKMIETIRSGNISVEHDFINENNLGDCTFDIDGQIVAIDVKTKIISSTHSSNPKIYNIDKFLEFHSTLGSVFLLLFVGVDIENEEIFIALRSPFDEELLDSQSIYSHWSGRARRGTVVYNEDAIESVIFRDPLYEDYINEDLAYQVITEFIDMKKEEN